MMQSGYTAALGIASQQRRMDVIANNLANVNTIGYKADRVDFKDALYQTMRRVIQPQEDINMRRGCGTLVSGVMVDFEQGGIQTTNVDTNLYIKGDAFFKVLTPQGQVLYTRDGTFSKDAQGYLVTGAGNYVLDQNNQRIQVQGNKFIISPEGQISMEDGPVYAQLGLVVFPNKEGLLNVAGNTFNVSEASGQPRQINANDGVSVISGAVESSNVQLANEFSRLVRAQRVFQFSSRALSVADSMDEKAINARR